MKKLVNVDTIYILVDVENYENAVSKILETLNKEKEIARARIMDNCNYIHMITLNSMIFQVKPSGSSRLLIYFTK